MVQKSYMVRGSFAVKRSGLNDTSEITPIITDESDDNATFSNIQDGVLLCDNEDSWAIIFTDNKGSTDEYSLHIPKKWQSKLDGHEISFDILFPISEKETRILRTKDGQLKATISERKREIAQRLCTTTITYSLMASIAYDGYCIKWELDETEKSFFDAIDKINQNYILTDLAQT